MAYNWDRSERALENFMKNRIVNPVQKGLEEKGKKGSLQRSVSFTITKNFQGLTAYGLANYYWRWGGGSGRRPGKNPPVQPLKDWLKKRGLAEGIAYWLSKKIGAEGSSEWRGDRGDGKNVFVTVPEEATKDFNELSEALRDDTARPIFDAFKNLEK